MTKPNLPKILGDTLRYEAGELSHDETCAFFQALVDSGLAWKLQGSYGRAAKSMIDAGLINPPQRECYGGGC